MMSSFFLLFLQPPSDIFQPASGGPVAMDSSVTKMPSSSLTLLLGQPGFLAMAAPTLPSSTAAEQR